jgi:serine/threonine protein kinase
MLFSNLTDCKFTDHFNLGKTLGSGALGEVRLCISKNTGEHKAVKIL